LVGRRENPRKKFTGKRRGIKKKKIKDDGLRGGLVDR